MRISTFTARFAVIAIMVLQSSCSEDPATTLIEAHRKEAPPKLQLIPFSVDFPRDKTFLPQSWIDDPISAEIEPLDPSLHEEAEAIIQRAMNKYPEALRTEFLAGVSLVGALRFYDVGYGGTYMANGRRIILVYRKNFKPIGFEQRLHHEFSSILLKKNKGRFEAERWKAANAPGFQYRAGGIIEEQTGDRSEATRVLEEEQKKTGGSGSGLLVLDTKLMEEGFLTLYNRVSIEQDLNETAAHLFTNPSLWTYSAAYPRIDHKVDVLIDFYRSLDPTLDRLYFRMITKNSKTEITPETSP